MPLRNCDRPAIHAICFLWLIGANTAAPGAATLSVRLAFVGAEENSALRGVTQGLEEANLQGSFLGQKYSLDVLEPATMAAADFSTYMAVLAAADRETLMRLAGLAAGRTVFNLTDPDDAMRETCLPNLLHIVPSAQMRRKAIAQWRTVHTHDDVAAAAWHPEFVKFAGRDLNKRFQKSFNVPMDEFSWAGWAAVKMAADSIAREGISNAGDLLVYLRTRLSFDGQKGVDMDFRETGQLRQPLLIIEAGRLVGEAPVRGVAEPDDLDSLDSSACRK